MASMTAAVLAAVIFFLLLTLPPAARDAEWGGHPALPSRTVAGAYHVHTTRSDGAASRADAAAAAAAAGLQFVLFTEHGDGTTAPEPPAYVSGVLCIDAVEISTSGGHYVALGLPSAPYPLGGEAAAVVEDVRRLGGFGFAAHPDSRHAELAWTDWSLPIDGLEWLNADSEWRDEQRSRLLRVLFDYGLRPAPALASTLDRPVVTLTRWDALSTRRPVVAIAAHDAHGGIGRGNESSGWRGVPVPSYEASFRTFSTRVVLDAPLTGDAAADAARLLAALREGRTFTAIDALAAPALLDVRRAADGALDIRTSTVEGAEIVVLQSSPGGLGAELRRVAGSHATLAAAELRGPTRVEVRVPGAPGTPPVPWIVSNVVAGGPLPADAAPHSSAADAREVAVSSWRPEHDPRSKAEVQASTDGAALEFELAPAPRGSQYAALVGDVAGGLAAAEAVRFEIRASRPMRVSVQLRYPGHAGARWGRSVYADASPRPVRLALADLLPLDGSTSSAPNPAEAASLLFVVDLVNARPGDQGRFTVRQLAVSGPDASAPAPAARR